MMLKRRILALLLTLCMVAVMVPMPVIAGAEEAVDDTSAVTEATEPAATEEESEETEENKPTGTPKATVTVLSPMVLTEGNYSVWGGSLPEGTVDCPLQIVMNFKANDTLEEAKAGGYSKYLCDFYLEFSGIKSGSLRANGCYLAGHYGTFGWIVIPVDGLEVENGVSYPVVSNYDATLNYEDICNSVKNFTAAIYISEEILEANPDFKVTLSLKMTNPDDANDVITVGQPATYDVSELLSNATGYENVEGLNAAENETAINTAVKTLKEELGLAEDAELEAASKLNIVAKSLPDEKGKIVYDVTPVVAANGKSVKIENLEEALSFRLLLLSDEEREYAEVFHGEESLGLTKIESENGIKYVEVSSKTFSEYSVAPVKTASTEAELKAALTAGGTVALLGDILVTEMIEIPAGVTAILNLNGHAITSGYQTTDETKHIYPFDVYGNLTIKDTEGEGSVEGRGIYVQDGAKLTVESGSVYGIDANGGSAIYQYGGDVIINGGLIEQKAEGTSNFAINAAAGTVTVNGGKVAGNHGAIAAVGAHVVIKDGEFVCTGTAGMTDNVLYSYGNGTITINGGTFIADSDTSAGGCCICDINGKATVNDGSFSNSSGGDVWGTTGTTINGGKFENLTETQHVTVGATIINGGKPYTKTENGKLEELKYTLSEFVEAVIAANGVYDGNGVTVEVTPASGDARTETTEGLPDRLQKYTNPEVYYAQYQRFGDLTDLTDVKISNVNFVFVPAAVNVVDAWNTAGATTTADNINGELQLLNAGSVELVNCTFDKMSVSPINASSVTVSGCEFKGLDAYAIKDIKAGTVSVTGTTFDDCNGGFWFNDAPETLTVTDNTFTGVGRRGAIQFSSNGDYTDTAMTVTGNEVTGGAFLWQLNNTVTYEQYSAILDTTKNTYVTATVDGSTIPTVPTLGGEGTEESPYLITSLEDLKLFRDLVNAGDNYSGKYIKVTAAEIDLKDEEWTPIGYMGATFKGNFDGNGVIIKNLKITKTLTNAAENNGIGLFGRTDDPAVIKNITIENVDITGSLYVGAVVGFAYTGKSIENCTVKGNIAIDAWWYAGVIGGNGYMNLVDNCHVIGNAGSYIKGNNGSYIGGIWGFRGEGANKITNCTVTNLSITGVDRVGGISGIAHYGNTISTVSVDTVTIEATDPEATTVGLVAGACQGTESEPSVIEEVELKEVSAKIGDENVTESLGLFGTNIGGTAPVTNFVAKIGNTYYKTFAEAAAAAEAGDTITLIANAYIAEGTDVTIPDGVTLDGNGFSILSSGADHDTTTSYGYVVAGGNLTIKGVTKIEKFSASYYNHVITIGEGASLEVFGKNRVTLGYGSDINVTGTISDAKTADKAQITPSLKIPAGISITGSNDTNFNVTNAYIVLGNTSSSNKSANAEFGMNFTNSIVEFTNQFTLSGVREGYESLTPVFNVNFKDSVVIADAKLCFAATGSNVVIDNSTVTTSSNIHNSGEITLKNGASLTGGMIQYGENGGNSGTIVVDNSTLTINNNNVAYAMDGKNTGKLILLNNATASVDYITETAITLGVGSALTSKSADLEVETESGYEAEYQDGKYVAVVAPVAKIGDVKYDDLLDALGKAKDGETVELFADVELYTRLIFSLYTNGKNVTLDGNGHRLYASSTNWGTGNGKHLINVNCDNVTLKDIVLDCNNIAEGANIYKAQNIVFDNVSIINKKGWNADLTVNGSTLTVVNELSASYVDVSLGKDVTTTLGIVAEEGAVLDTRTLQISSAAYPNTNLDKALSTDGTPYYSLKKVDANGNLAGYSNSLSRLSNGYGYELLEDMTVSSNVTLLNEGHTGSLNTNGHTLTVADGKTVTVNGALEVKGEGTIEGAVALGNANASVSGAEISGIKSSVDNSKVVYENGEYVVALAVANIGENEYYTLKEALEAAQTGDEIVLLTDTTEEINAFENVKFVSGVEGGVTVTNTATGWTDFNNVTLGTGVTLKSTNIYSNGSDSVNIIEGKLVVEATYYHSGDAKTTIQNGGTVWVGSQTVVRYNYDEEAGIYIYGDSNDDTVEFYSGGTNALGVYSGTFYAENANVEAYMFWIDYWKNGSGEGDEYAQSKPVFKNSTLDVTTELRFYKDATITLEDSAVTAGKVQVRENATSAISEMSIDNSTIKADTVENLSGATFNAILGEDGTVSFEPVVAKIGNTDYTTLQAAIDAAQEGDTVTLLTDLTIESDLSDAGKGYFNIADGKKVTIDLNGKTINATDNSTGNFILFYSYGELTIKNGTINLTATNDRDWNAESAIILNRGGVLNVESGTYTHNGGTDMAFVVDNSGNWYGDATANIFNGTLTSTYIAIRNRMEQNSHGASGTAYLNVEGGTISGSSRAIWAQASSTSETSPAKGEINVSGGEIGLIDTPRGTGAESMTVITGGTVAAFKGEVGELKVTGGTLGEVTILTADGEAAEYVITNEGLYIAAAAKIGDTNYASVFDALKASKDNDTIIILPGKHTVPDLTHVHFYANGDKLPENLTVKGEGEGVILDALHFNTQSLPSNMTVENITFDGEGVAPYSGGISSGNGANGLTVRNCSFINGAFLSIANEVAKNVVVENCVFDGVASGSSAIYIQKVDGLTVTGTTVKNGSYNAIQCNSSVAGNITIKNNIFSGINSRNIYLNGLTEAYNGILTIEGNSFCVPATPKTDGNYLKTAIPVSIGYNTYEVDPTNNMGLYFTNVDICVAKIGDVEYADIQAALTAAQAGDKVILASDVVTGNVIPNNGVIIDLNGNVLEVNTLVAFDSNAIIDSVGGGKVKIADATRFVLHDRDNGGYMPIYSGDGFVFAEMNLSRQLIFADTTETNNSAKVVFRPIFGTLTPSDFFKDGAVDNKIHFNVDVLYYDALGDMIERKFTFAESIVESVYREYVEGETPSGFALTFTNISTSISDMTVSISVVSDSGVIISHVVGVINATTAAQ